MTRERKKEDDRKLVMCSFQQILCTLTFFSALLSQNNTAGAISAVLNVLLCCSKTIHVPGSQF